MDKLINQLAQEYDSLVYKPQKPSKYKKMIYAILIFLCLFIAISIIAQFSGGISYNNAYRHIPLGFSVVSVGIFLGFSSGVIISLKYSESLKYKKKTLCDKSFLDKETEKRLKILVNLLNKNDIHIDGTDTIQVLQLIIDEISAMKSQVIISETMRKVFDKISTGTFLILLVAFLKKIMENMQLTLEIIFIAYAMFVICLSSYLIGNGLDIFHLTYSKYRKYNQLIADLKLLQIYYR